MAIAAAAEVMVNGAEVGGQTLLGSENLMGLGLGSAESWGQNSENE